MVLKLVTDPETSMPESVVAEKAILGSILIDAFAYSVVSSILREGDFFSESHRRIYHGMSDLASKSLSIDLITLKDQLARTNALDKAGGPAYLASLVDDIPDVANVEDYAKLVKEKSVLRNLIQLGHDLTQSGKITERTVEEVVGDAASKIFEVAQDTVGAGFVPLRELAEKSLEMLEVAKSQRGMLTGLDTGFRRLNEMTSGLQRGELIILAARPSVGKTSFALNIAQHAAIRAMKSVAFFSIEMSKEALATRILCSEAAVDSKKARDGFASDEDFRHLALAQTRLAGVKFFIDDSSALTVPQMRARCQRLKRDHGLDLVVVDYLQLMMGHGSIENRTQEVSQISRGLKLIAKDLDVPVLALSQLSRQTERRSGADRKPQLADLRDSGSIEQDADVVIFLYREELYDPETDRKNLADVLIRKQRNGPTGDFTLVFMPQLTTFNNFDPAVAEPGF